MASTPAGPSTRTHSTSSPRKHNRTQADRQIQRRWIQLIDHWHSSSSSNPSTATQPFGTASRDQLVEEISQHAQTLCRTIKDKTWLLDAFQLGIHAVLFPESRMQEISDQEEQSRVEQLGQQLLQLAIHSVATPYLRSLKEHNAETSRVEAVHKTVDRFEQLSKKLSVAERLRGITESLGLPTLPLALVLEEESSTLLLCLASLPQAAMLVEPLLKAYPWLVQESADVRLAIVAQMMTAGAGGREEHAALAAAGLLIGWKDGKEVSIWQSAQGVQQLTLQQLVGFYSGLLESLRQTKSDAAASALLEVLSEEWQGSDAQTALTQLKTTISFSPGAQQQLQPTFPANQSRFDLSSIQALRNQISTTTTTISTSKQARTQLAKQLLVSNSSSISGQLSQLVDTYDSASMRSFAFAVVAEANPSAEMARLTAAVLYARPAVGGFRLDLDTPKSLLDEAEAVLAQQLKGGKSSEKRDSKLGKALRNALNVDRKSVVPSCQLLTLLAKEDAVGLLGDAQQHVQWLREITALVEGQNDKPEMLDLCWIAAFGGAAHLSRESKAEAENQQKAALDTLVTSFATAHPPPSSLSGRPADRPSTADTSTLRFRAAWDSFFYRTLELCTPLGAFALISQDHATRLLLAQILRTGDVDLFKSLTSSSSSSSSSSSTSTLSPSELEDLVLDVSTSLFDQATVASTRSKDIRLSLSILSSLSVTSTRALAFRNFVEAACRLSSFKIRSPLHPTLPLTPSEIRGTQDKMNLISLLLASQEDAFKSPELVLDLAMRLCSLAPLSVGEKGLVEARTLAMLTESAVAAESFEEASGFVQRLIAQCRQQKTEAGKKVVELGWKSSLQLAKHPNWTDTPGRIRSLGNAMVLCPTEQLGGTLRLWERLQLQLEEELESGGMVFNEGSTRKGGYAGAGAINWAGGGMGDLLSSQTAAAAELVGSAANLLPLSFSPLSYFGSSSSSSSSSSTIPQTSTTTTLKNRDEKEVDERTAKLFDFDNLSGASQSASDKNYVDPTERAVRAARAARDFLGWKGQRSQDAQDGQDASVTSAGGLGGFSFSRGVGWLIGEEKR
ncbi:uncharacterized protein UTRI_01727 [Ustilago trichophora]|uniref:Sec39 domain-containing protein n=1 Tax=Ustilago trichophora TaxID=86804 RepID=A0A5C3E0W7_9BASI|nr:uncharacterized protein UTRI_01727 [Ustilago trichophora]